MTLDLDKEKDKIHELFNKMTDDEFHQTLINCGFKEKLKITNIDKLKITKVKPWAIYFDYDEEKYLLHEEEEDIYSDLIVVLYKRKLINNDGKYELEYMYEIPYASIPYIEYNNKTRDNGTLSQIDKKELVWNLTWKGIIDSEFSNEIENRKKEIERLEHLKKKLYNTIEKHIKQYRKMD